MKRLLEKEGNIWFGFGHGHHRVYVSGEYWTNGLKFHEFIILKLLNRFTKYRLTISQKDK